MELPDFSLSLIQGFLICLARVAAMFAVLPVFSGAQLPPPQMRVGGRCHVFNVDLPDCKELHPAGALTPIDLA